MSKNILYYQETGKVGVLGIVLILVLGGGFALGLSWVYAWVTGYSPFIYINGLATIILGVFMGLIIGQAGVWGKIQNFKFVLGSSVVFSLVTLWLAWVFWVDVKGDLDHYAWNPAEIISVVGQHSEVDGFSWAVWIIEAALLIVCCVWITTTVGRRPFCRVCNKWVKNEIVIENLHVIAKPHHKEAIAELENKDFSRLLGLSKVHPHHSKQARIRLMTCDTCDSLRYLTLEHIEVTMKNDKPDENDEVIIRNLIITDEEFQQIRAAHGA